MNILQDLAEALLMAQGLSFWTALPIYVIGYSVAVYAVFAALSRIRKFFRDKE
jgi:hypothetical protein|nr:MAG TPA: hypothetical protein [Caudoviricetes sp.]